MKDLAPPTAAPTTGRQYWRSLDELADTPEFRAWMEREFPAGASEFTDPLSRRYFVKIMSASFLLAGVGLTGCRRPVETILPFSKLPQGYLYGVPQYYATAMPAPGGALPLVVRANDGRPTKIEGNPEHPLNRPGAGQSQVFKQGATDVFAQAAILGLYDPDRAQRFTFKGENVAREKALDFLTQTARQAAANQGRGLCFLVEASDAPSRARLQKVISDKYPQARWFGFNPVEFDVPRQAATLAFGQPVRPFVQLERARRIVALDCDFLGLEADAFRQIRGFARGRRLERPTDDMSRLYVVEGVFSLTGMNADHRLAVPAGAIFPVACRLAAEVIEQSHAQDQDSRAGEFRQALLKASAGLKVDAGWVRECVKDLLAHRGEVVVLAGHRQPVEVHLLAQAINFHLGAVGSTVLLAPASDPGLGSLSALARALNAGEVETLAILGGNPAYSAPADLNWPQAQRKARTVLRLGDYEDETFALTDWHLPAAHFLESWGDARSSDGTLVPVQPLIEPLFGGVTELEVLARLGGVADPSPYAVVRETFRQLAPAGVFEENWKKFLHDGYWEGSAAAPVTAEYDWASAAPAILAGRVLPPPTAQQLEVVFQRDYRLDDGRYNNNGWLQELPDPITKLTWDNVILLSERTAAELGVVVVDHAMNNLRVPVVRLEAGGRAIEGPAWIQPGLADYQLVVTLGYGRTATGRVGVGTGYNGYPLRTSTEPNLATGAKLSLTGRDYSLACAQDHWGMEGRPIVREANLETYRREPEFVEAVTYQEPPVVKPLYPNPLDVPNAQGVTPKQAAMNWWGLVVDLNSCVGCSACVIACQSENNIPIVGKDQVRRHREMHWIRIDRYYTGPVADPQAVVQPMMCQHCESAPCENVCPVNATVHDAEGLNQMVYNRCVGTRYCSNNCPYKVRRFNFFDYNRRPLNGLYKSPLTSFTNGEWELKRWFFNPDRGSRKEDEWDLLKLAKNPDVTVRMRGVMEKCSMCVQRIEQAKIARKVRAGASGEVEVPDGVIQTACQQACPAEAIVFGNLKDPTTQVSRAHAQTRNYAVLSSFLTKPRVTYLARVRNPNPAMPDYHTQPLSTTEFLSHGNQLRPLGAAGGEAGREQKGAP